MTTDFVDILSPPNGKYEQQNKLLKYFIIIINYCIIINSYYNYKIN